MLNILPILFLCAVCVACNQTNQTSTQNKQAAHNQADWETTAKVKQAIMSNKSISMSNRTVSVSTNKGIVILSGTVSNQDQVNEILKTASNVSGVKSINNQMSLQD